MESKLSGFVAKIFQHEFDHLEGRLYLDRVEKNEDIFAESEYIKLVDGVLNTISNE
jgi:peptide deformylase